MAKKKQELILKIGGAGGSISVWSVSGKDGTISFAVGTDESTLKEFLKGDDANGINFKSKIRVFHSFTEALVSLEKYPWYKLQPMFVHQDFIDPVLKALMVLADEKEVDRWKQDMKYVNELDRKQD
ncbi:MAG: hypothetical protein WBN66_01095 [Smithella sp.]